jgi:hypothetical protein
VTIRSNQDANLAKYAKREGIIFPHLLLPEIWGKDSRKLPSLETPSTTAYLIRGLEQRPLSRKLFDYALRWLRSSNSSSVNNLQNGDVDNDDTKEASVESNVPASSISVGPSIYVTGLRESMECIKLFLQVRIFLAFRVDLENVGLMNVPSLGGVCVGFFQEKLKPSSVVSYETYRRQQQTEIVRAFAWHWYKQIFAVAHRSDTIFIYDLNRERKMEVWGFRFTWTY